MRANPSVSLNSISKLTFQLDFGSFFALDHDRTAFVLDRDRIAKSSDSDTRLSGDIFHDDSVSAGNVVGFGAFVGTKRMTNRTTGCRAARSYPTESATRKRRRFDSARWAEGIFGPAAAWDPPCAGQQSCTEHHSRDETRAVADSEWLPGRRPTFWDR